jgi:hypothetical protein
VHFLMALLLGCSIKCGSKDWSQALYRNDERESLYTQGKTYSVFATYISAVSKLQRSVLYTTYTSDWNVPEAFWIRRELINLRFTVHNKLHEVLPESITSSCKVTDHC